MIDQESGGVVVAFGCVTRQSTRHARAEGADGRSRLWHVDCFRCANCKEKVSADTNLLLLTNGNPVCGDCSYQVSYDATRHCAANSSASSASKPSRKRRL